MMRDRLGGFVATLGVRGFFRLWFLASASVLVACAGTRAVPASEPIEEGGAQALATEHALIERAGLAPAAVCAALRSSEPDPIARFGRVVPLVTDGYLVHLTGCGQRAGEVVERKLVELGIKAFRYVDCASEGVALWIPGVDEPSRAQLDGYLEATSCSVRFGYLSRPGEALERLRAAALMPDVAHDERLFCQYREPTDEGFEACVRWIAGETAKLREELTKPSPHALIEHEGMPVTAVCEALRAKHADPLQGFWRALPVLRHGSLLELEGCGTSATSAIDDLLPRLGSYHFKQVDCGAGVRALWIFGRPEAAEAFEAAVAETTCRVRSREHFSPERGALHLRAVLAHDAVLAAQLRVTCQYAAESVKYLKRCLEDVPQAIQTLRDDARLAD